MKVFVRDGGNVCVCVEERERDGIFAYVTSC